MGELLRPSVDFPAEDIGLKPLPFPERVGGSAGGKPPIFPRTAVGGMYEEDPRETRLSGQEGMREILGLWTRMPVDEINTAEELLAQITARTKRLSQILEGTSLSEYSRAYLEVVAEASWVQGRTPEEEVPFREEESLQEVLQRVFISDSHSPDLESYLYRRLLADSSDRFGDKDHLREVRKEWNTWIRGAEI